MATYSANTYYEYTNQRIGSFSGGAWNSSLGNAPHPQAISYARSTTGDTIVDLSSITIGGFNGLNN
jgi:hypothetical protein